MTIDELLAAARARLERVTAGSGRLLLTERTGPLMLLCAEGYQSSLAAATLHDLGITDATDVIDGFEGWRAAGLPVAADS